MREEKLGQDPAFPISVGNQFKKGISKRFYAACAAMNLHESYISVDLEDEDMIKDKDGNWVELNGKYYIPRYGENKSEKYSIKTSYEYRFVRTLYRIADELLKQEKL